MIASILKAVKWLKKISLLSPESDRVNKYHLPGGSRIDSTNCTCELWIRTKCSEFRVKRDLSAMLYYPLGEDLEVEISTNCIVDQQENNDLLKFSAAAVKSMVSYNIAPLEWLTTLITANIYWVLFMWNALCKTYVHSHFQPSQQPHVVGAMTYLSVQTRNTRHRIINNLGRVTHLISDYTLINNLLVMQPNL